MKNANDVVKEKEKTKKVINKMNHVYNNKYRKEQIYELDK